jgi:hypothetical protein
MAATLVTALASVSGCLNKLAMPAIFGRCFFLLEPDRIGL